MRSQRGSAKRRARGHKSQSGKPVRGGRVWPCGWHAECAGRGRAQSRPGQSSRRELDSGRHLGRLSAHSSAARRPGTAPSRPPSPPCTPTRHAQREYSTGCRSSAGRTSCSGSPAARSCSAAGPSRSAKAEGPAAGLAGPGQGGPWPAPPHRRLVVPAREGGRPSGAAARLYADAARSAPKPRPNVATSPGRRRRSRSSAAWVINRSHKANGVHSSTRSAGHRGIAPGVLRPARGRSRSASRRRWASTRTSPGTTTAPA